MGNRLEPIEQHEHGLPDQVFERIGAAIIDGRFAPGERMKDAELASALGISRTPVREAIQRLTRIGLVEVVASRYTRVTTPTPELVRHTLEYTGYQAGLAVRMAVPRLSAEDLAHAVGLVDEMAEASERDNAPELYAASRAFYRLMSAATGNVVFVTMMREAGMAMERNLRGLRPLLGSTAERQSAYAALRAALVSRDAVAAERCARDQHRLPFPLDT